MAGDMKFVGLFMIIIGALDCLSIVGALVGIPLIFAGLRAREAGDAYLAYAQGDYSALGRAFIGQASHFKIIKILVIIGLVLFCLYIIAVIAIMATVGLSGILNH